MPEFCMLSSWCCDEMPMALVALFVTELLSAWLAITPASGSRSNFQCLLWSGSCVADLAGILLWHWDWCIYWARCFFGYFSADFFLFVSATISLTGLRLDSLGFSIRGANAPVVFRMFWLHLLPTFYYLEPKSSCTEGISGQEPVCRRKLQSEGETRPPHTEATLLKF